MSEVKSLELEQSVAMESSEGGAGDCNAESVCDGENGICSADRCAEGRF